MVKYDKTGKVVEECPTCAEQPCARCEKIGKDLRVPGQQREGWQNGEPTKEHIEMMTADTPIEGLTDFQKGARAMFDSLTFRAANHWHPTAMEQCNYDNKLIYEWVEDALEEVDPGSIVEWRAIDSAFRDGVKLGKQIKTAEQNNGMIDEHIGSLKDIAAVCGFFMMVTMVGAMLSDRIPKEAILWIFMSTFFVLLLVNVATLGRMSHLKSTKRGGENNFKPPYPMPPSRPPEGWTPKM